MFTGIVETLGEIVNIEKEAENVHLYVKSTFTQELKIDQSVSHNGVCLTVVAIEGAVFKVTAIKETLLKTSIAEWSVGDLVNLERGLKLGDRLDGHIVQGHEIRQQVVRVLKMRKVVSILLLSTMPIFRILPSKRDLLRLMVQVLRLSIQEKTHSV